MCSEQLLSFLLLPKIFYDAKCEAFVLAGDGRTLAFLCYPQNEEDEPAYHRTRSAAVSQSDGAIEI